MHSSLEVGTSQEEPMVQTGEEAAKSKSQIVMTWKGCVRQEIIS